MKTCFSKKFFLQVIVVLMLFILGACGSQTQSGEDDSTEEKGLPESYPDKEVEALIGFGPGSSVDITTRKLVEVLKSEGIMDQSIIINNMPGGAGAIAFQELKKNNNDPYIIMPNVNFGPPLWKDSIGVELSDFQPVASFASADMYIVVPKSSPYNDIKDLLDTMKSNPEKIIFSIVGAIDAGSAYNISSLGKAYGIENINFLPAEGSENWTHILNGQADATIGIGIQIKDYVKTGDMKALAVLSSERSEDFPDVPTLKEATGIDFEAYRTFGLFVGGEVSADVVDYWENTIKQVTQSEAWNEFLKTQGYTPRFMDSEEYAEFVKTDGEKYREYIQSLK